jgi:RNA polymerase sigma factor (sigma-70 family)
MQPDAVLCKLCARGSDDAFAVLHARYSQQVFAFVFHLLNRPGSVDDAEDLTQEILGKAFSNMSNRREEGSFKAWLFRIARNHTFDHIRARRPVAASFDDPNFAIEPSNVISLQHEVEKRSEMSWLLAAMGRLPERQREALVMRELGGMSYDEISETLETTPEGVKQLIKHGRANVSHAAEASGYRSKSLKRDLALATPIVTIGWIGAGAGKASAAAALGSAAAGTGGAAVSGGAVAGGTGLAIAGGKVAATVLAVIAVGTGSVVVGEQVASERSNSETQSQATPSKASGTPAVPAQSLTVGAKAAERAKANKLLANARRERAKERRAKARAKRAAASERAAAGKAHAKNNAAKGQANGKTKSTGQGNSSGGGSANGNSGSANSGSEKRTGSGGQGGSGQSTTEGSGGGSGNGSANSNAGGKTKE